MLTPENLVSHTLRMATAEQLAEHLTEHLASLPVTEAERDYLHSTLEVMLNTLRAEITDWQRLACTASKQALTLVSLETRPSVDLMFDVGVCGGLIIARAADTLGKRQFTRDELRTLSFTWPKFAPQGNLVPRPDFFRPEDSGIDPSTDPANNEKHE